MKDKNKIVLAGKLSRDQHTTLWVPKKLSKHLNKMKLRYGFRRKSDLILLGLHLLEPKLERQLRNRLENEEVGVLLNADEAKRILEESGYKGDLIE